MMGAPGVVQEIQHFICSMWPSAVLHKQLRV
jgi:hypothetical protein